MGGIWAPRPLPHRQDSAVLPLVTRWLDTVTFLRGVKLKQTVIVELKLVRNSWLVHVIVVDIAVVRAALG